IDPRTGEPSRGIASVTLVGTSLAISDAYATAALAMGTRCYAWLSALNGFQSFVVSEDGQMWSGNG
ncbi:MAG TPA: FAD:protein FMN transferase, partial [Jatrophihabitans sp.]